MASRKPRYVISRHEAATQDGAYFCDLDIFKDFGFVMDFPFLGDATTYMDLGQSCAHYLTTPSAPVNGCYNPIRPLGIALYFAVPFLFTRDLVTANYLTLLMNLLFFGLLLSSGFTLINRFSADLSWLPYGRSINRMKLIIFMAGALILSIGFLPVRLSDHQSLALFMASVALLSSNGDIPKKTTALMAGLLAGAAVLLKQNYAVATVFLVLSWLAICGRGRFRDITAPAFWFCVGAALGLLQIVWVYYHGGVPWLYEPAAMETYAPSNRQPVVELIAYSTPIKSAYVSTLVNPVSDFEYFATKFFHGIGKFYWAVYSGEAPLETSPEKLDYSGSAMLKFEGIYLITAAVCFASLVFKNRWLAIFVITSFLSVSISTAIAHTESRYFYFFRVACIIYVIVAGSNIAAWYANRKSIIPNKAVPHA